MNIRRTLPLRSLAVFNSSALTSSVNSILLPPRILFLEHYTTPGQFSFRKSLSNTTENYFERVNIRLGAMDAHLSFLQESANKTDKRLDAIETQLTEHKTLLTEHKTLLTQILARLPEKP